MQLSLRCRGDAPDTFQAKLQDALRTRPPPASTPQVPLAPPAAPKPELEKATTQLVDDMLLQQLVDMVIIVLEAHGYKALSIDPPNCNFCMCFPVGLN